MRQLGPCVRALCEAVAVLLSKNMTCARPRCNATSSKHFPHTSHCTLHTSQSTLQKTIVLRVQPQQEATLTQPLQCDPQRPSCKTHRSTRNGAGNRSSKTESRRHSRKKTILKHFGKGFLEGKLLAPKLRKSADKSLSQPGCSHSNTIYEIQLQKTIVLRMQPRHQATLTQPLQCDLERLSCKTQ